MEKLKVCKCQNCIKKCPMAEMIHEIAWGRHYAEKLLAKEEKGLEHLRRAETENKPLTLEQMREMDEKPVWIEDLLHPKLSQWIVIAQHSAKTLFSTSGKRLSFCLYDEKWLAYNRKPEVKLT